MSKQEVKIQRVELRDGESALFCPFCGQRVGLSDAEVETNAESAGPYSGPCAHTLFIAHDMGFTFRSQAFNRLMGLDASFEDDDPELEDYDGVDAFTDAVPAAHGVKFAIYQGPPSFYGTYVGFSQGET